MDEANQQATRIKPRECEAIKEALLRAWVIPPHGAADAVADLLKAYAAINAASSDTSQ